MTLFTVGPVEMDPEILELGRMPLPYFRTAEFSTIMQKLSAQYLEFLSAGPGSQGLFLTASGSGGMEAAVSSVFTSEDKLLVIEGGSFGRRFVQLCEHYQIPHVVHKVAFEEDLTAEDLEAYRDGHFTAVLVNHHETSIGKLYDLAMLGAFCRDIGAYLIVDAVSSFLSEEILMDAWGVDLVMTASQKCLALAPGLALVACSERLLNERIRVNPGLSYYLSLQAAAANQERGQTPFTPALSIIFQLEKRFAQIAEKGIEAEYAEKAALAAYFRPKIEALGYKIPSYSKSNALTPLLTEPLNAYNVFLRLKDEDGLVITPSGGEHETKLTRVGHMGFLSEADYEPLLERMAALMSEVKQ